MSLEKESSSRQEPGRREPGCGGGLSSSQAKSRCTGIWRLWWEGSEGTGWGAWGQFFLLSVS